MEGYAVTQLCEKYNLSKRTIYYYMSIGLLPPAKQRGKNNVYSKEFANQLEKILHLRKGMKLTQLQKFLDVTQVNNTDCIISVRIFCDDKDFFEYANSAILKEIRRLSMHSHFMGAETGESLIVMHPANSTLFNTIEGFCNSISNFSQHYNGGVKFRINTLMTPYSSINEE